MTEDEAGRARREEEILERWRTSADQLKSTAEATASGDLTVANSWHDLDERRERLARRRIDLHGIVDRDDSLWASFLSAGATAARAVGRVVTPPSPGRPSDPIGSGALIGPNLFITNNHVIGSETDAAATGVEFGYEWGDDGSHPVPVYYPFEPDRFFVTDAELDFTVVAVADRETPPGATYGTVLLIGETGKAVKAEYLNVVHHPNGDPKRISIRENQLVAEDELWVRYRSDAKPGSSGAPVFNDQWEVVALHHGGVPVRDANGADLALDGQRWTPDMGRDAKAYTANEGARVSRIVRRLRAADLPATQRELIDQALTRGDVP